jgi:hypothetical protein
MLSGFEAQRSIDQAYAQLRNEEARLDAGLRSASDDTARLRQERLNQLKALAELKLKLLQSGALARDLDAAEQRVKELLERARAELSAAARRRDDAHQAILSAEAARNDCAAALEAAVGALKAFEADVASRYAADADWLTLKQGLETAQKTHEEAEKKTKQAEDDREKKKVPYENDRLFLYLWRRKLGTSEYASGFLVRMVDEWIARLVNYREARANYVMLIEIPARLRAHVEGLGAALEAAKQRLAAFQQEKLAAAGGVPLQQRTADAKAALDAAEAEVSRAHKAFEAAEAQYRAVADKGQQGVYAQAIDLMVENDSRDDIATLFREAARTRSDEDRAIVEKIDQLTKGIAAADRQVAQLRGSLVEVSQRRAEIERARAEFLQRGYNYPGGGFGNEAAIHDVLGGILQGVIKGAVLGQVLQQGYRGPPPGWGPRDDGWGPPSGWGGGRSSGPVFPGGFDDGPSIGGGGDDFSTGGSF